MTDVPPARVDRYEILAELGRGAMGIVYRAHDPELNRDVAIKTLRRDLGLPSEEYADLRARFYREAKAAGHLGHPSIVTVHDVIERDGVPYIVMEHLHGETLADRIATRGPLPPEDAVALAIEVSAGLGYAHARGVVHRDVKPGNIIVGPHGGAKITDFGIARIVGHDVTRTGMRLGTPSYMAPEQLLGRPADGRSDLFSLGVVLYEALTGTHPFRGEDLSALLYQIVHATPPPAAALCPAVPAALDAVLARALAKEPEARFPTTEAFAEALADALARPPPGVAGPAGVAAARARRALAGPRARAALLGLGALLAIGLGSWGLRAWVPGASPGRHSGSIAVASDTAVEVFVDGVFRGRVVEPPLVVADVAPGSRIVTLRHGTREREFQGVVRERDTWTLTHYFASQDAARRPDARPDSPDALAAAKARLREMEAQFRRDSREALDRLRGVLDRAGSGPAPRPAGPRGSPGPEDSPR